MPLGLSSTSRFAVAGLGLVVALVTAPSARAEEVWEVYMKTAACSETLRDWMTVASVNPTGRGGSDFYFPARHPQGSSAVRFPRTPAGFTNAHAQADAQRLRGFMASADTATGAKYQRYCCNTWSVWRPSNGQGPMVTHHGQGHPGSGFEQVAGDLCCEDAAVLAGSTSGCGSFQLASGETVVLTADGPKVQGPVAVQLDGITVAPAGTTAPTDTPAKIAAPGAWDGRWVGSVSAHVKDATGEVRIVPQAQTITVKRQGTTLTLTNKSGEAATFELAPDGLHAKGSMTEHGVTLNATLTLSADGSTLTLDSTFNDPRGGTGKLAGQLKRAK